MAPPAPDAAPSPGSPGSPGRAGPPGSREVGPSGPRGVGLGVLLALLALLLTACGSSPAASSPAAGAGGTGTRGASGADGRDGADGSTGVDGVDGADGADGGVVTSDGRTMQRDVQQVEYHRPITALDLETAAGGIEVVGDAPADTVRITRTRSWRGAEPVVTDTWTGTTLTTRVSCDSCGVAFEVHVPPQVATRLVAGSGRVRVDGLTGDAELRSSAGGVRATGLSARTVTATSRSGGVTLDLATVPDAVVATTSAGAVELAVPGGTAYAVDAATDAGRVRVGVPVDPASPRRLTARSSAGSVTVVVR